MDQTLSHSEREKEIYRGEQKWKKWKPNEVGDKGKGKAELKNVKQAANSTPNLCRTAASVVNNNLRQNGTESRPRQGTGNRPDPDDDGQDNNRKQQPVSSSRKYISFF